MNIYPTIVIFLCILMFIVVTVYCREKIWEIIKQIWNHISGQVYLVFSVILATLSKDLIIAIQNSLSNFLNKILDKIKKPDNKNKW